MWFHTVKMIQRGKHLGMLKCFPEISNYGCFIFCTPKEVSVSQHTYKHILTFLLHKWKEISGFYGGQNSHCGLLDYDTVWSGSWVQHSEGTHSLHLQGRRWRLYASPKRRYRHTRLCVPSLQTNYACNISGLSAAVEFHVRSDTKPWRKQCYFSGEFYKGPEYNTCIHHSGTMFQCLCSHPPCPSW